MRKATIYIVVVLLMVCCAIPAYANGIPALPHAFYGSVTINGAPAPDGSQISATVGEGTVIATQNPVTTAGGSYGISNPKLLVQGDILNGATITFYVNGVEAEGQTGIFEAGGGPTPIALAVTIARPSGGGGGGGGGGGPRDTTPPVISDVWLCYEGVTETTADICWKTDELGTSQAEYWASEHMLSPLDERLLFNHHVRLTGLTMGTTYHYCTMSCNCAGNLCISDEQTFTTLGAVPAAAFAMSALSISPSEVDIGEAVTISVSVTNAGNATGSYEVVLKINGAVEATKGVVLDSGASEEVTFTTTKDVAVSYSVEVDGLSGSFTVKEEEAPPTPPPPPEASPAPPVVPPPPGINWAIVGPIIAVAVFLAIFLPLRRRRRAS